MSYFRIDNYGEKPSVSINHVYESSMDNDSNVNEKNKGEIKPNEVENYIHNEIIENLLVLIFLLEYSLTSEPHAITYFEFLKAGCFARCYQTLLIRK